MAFMRREHLELLLGFFVLLLGLGLLLFTFSQTLAIAAAPGDFARTQLTPETTPVGPTASFRWTSDGSDATVEDTSRAGDAAIASWDWDFGDGTRASGPNPASHTYADPSLYQVSLILRDGNGKESRALAQVEVVPSQTRSGVSLGDPTSSLPPPIDWGVLLRPVGAATLTVGMYAVMAMVGGAVTKAGWSMIKPKAETIRLRLKPRHLARAIEEDSGSVVLLPPPPAT